MTRYNGFTLVELLLTLSVSSIIALTVVSFVKILVPAVSLSQESAELIGGATVFFNLVERQIEKGDILSVSADQRCVRSSTHNICVEKDGQMLNRNSKVELIGKIPLSSGINTEPVFEKIKLENKAFLQVNLPVTVANQHFVIRRHYFIEAGT